jgi:rod shape determining protein RodA
MRRSRLDLTNPGWAIAAAIGVLTLVGVASIYVTDTHYAAGHDGPLNAARQSLRIFLGLLLAAATLRVGHLPLGRAAYPIFVAATLLLVPLLVAKLLHTSLGGLTSPRNGAYRWISLPGFLLQPSELMKLAVVVALAAYLCERKNLRTFGGVLAPILACGIPMGLILLEPDLGTALILVPVLLVMLFLAGAKVWHLSVFVVAGFAVVPLAWGRLEAYQRLRVTAVLLQSDELRQTIQKNPDAYPAIATKRQALEWSAGSGYQLVQSKNAIGGGGVWGRGWGKGIYVENPFLPDRHNDFIFAIVAHQWGLAGCVIVVVCYLVIVLAGARIASASIDPFARLVAAGVVTLLGCQAVVSVSMTMGLLPVTGMTLPFVSYGGSSLLCNFVAVALLISISQHRPYVLTREPFTFRREHIEKLHASQSPTRAPTHAATP